MEEVQLICVGYAGSTAANFNLLMPYFKGRILFSPVEYRGRGTRGRRGNNAVNACRAERMEGAAEAGCVQNTEGTLIKGCGKNAEGAAEAGCVQNTEGTVIKGCGKNAEGAADTGCIQNTEGAANKVRRKNIIGEVNDSFAENGKNIINKEYSDNIELVYDVADQVKKLRRPELPYAILGYSMGAQVVYELFAQGLLTEKPRCIFIAAHEPPDVPCAGKDIDLCDREAFLERVKQYGGMDIRLLQDARFASIFLERMRADFRLLQEYSFSGEYHSFPSRAVMLYSEEDTPLEIVRGWQRFSEKEMRFFPLGNSHFFFRTHAEEFCGIILRELGLMQPERLEGSVKGTDQV